MFKGCLKKVNRGFSLVELMAAMSILTIVISPFLASMLEASRNNALADERIQGSTIAQKTMEEMKARGLFLADEAVTDPDSLYKTYSQTDKITVKYKILKNPAVLTPLPTPRPDFEFIDDSDYGIQMTVIGGEVTLNGLSYPLKQGINLIQYKLDVLGNSGIYKYKFYREGDINPPEKSLGIEKSSKIDKINIKYLNGSTDGFKLGVDIDGIDIIPEFYVVDDTLNALQIINSGHKSFNKFYSISSSFKDYANTLYKIEVLVEKSGKEINKTISYVKK